MMKYSKLLNQRQSDANLACAVRIAVTTLLPHTQHTV